MSDCNNLIDGGAKVDTIVPITTIRGFERARGLSSRCNHTNKPNRKQKHTRVRGTAGLSVRKRSLKPRTCDQAKGVRTEGEDSSGSKDAPLEPAVANNTRMVPAQREITTKKRENAHCSDGGADFIFGGHTSSTYGKAERDRNNPDVTSRYGGKAFESADDVESYEEPVVASNTRGEGIGGKEIGPVLSGLCAEKSSYRERPCFGRAKHAAELPQDAAVLKIGACWRGFLGRGAAKWALRSVLLNELRKLGGGKISKVRHRGIKG